jgi:glycopeptide antibiotics resistance protein
MGKREVRVIRVPRWATVILLLITAAAMAAVIHFLSGRAVARERMSFAEIISIILRYDRGQMSNAALLATIAPAIVDALLFVPFGALTFLTFDRGEGRRAASYALTLTVGVAIALAHIAWQEMLATRVTGWFDAFWNTFGCAAGAALGHTRKRVRFRFE